MQVESKTVGSAFTAFSSPSVIDSACIHPRRYVPFELYHNFTSKVCRYCLATLEALTLFLDRCEERFNDSCASLQEIEDTTTITRY